MSGIITNDDEHSAYEELASLLLSRIEEVECEGVSDMSFEQITQASLKSSKQ